MFVGGGMINLVEIDFIKILFFYGSTFFLKGCCCFILLS